MRTIGESGEGAGSLELPGGLAFDAAGLLNVADGGNHRIDVFTPDCVFERAIGKEVEFGGTANVYSPSGCRAGVEDGSAGAIAGPNAAEAIWRGIWLEEAHNSTAIEGNTLVLKQVAQLLEEGRAVGNKELSEYLEVRGYADAANWVYGHGIRPGDWGGEELVTLAELREVHSLAMTPVWDVAPHPQASARERPGSFREHDIEAFPAGMRPPEWPQVPALVDDWIADARALRDAEPTELIEALAALHARFEQIHPFLDGDGRADSPPAAPAAGSAGIPPSGLRRNSGTAPRRCSCASSTGR